MPRTDRSPARPAPRPAATAPPRVELAAAPPLDPACAARAAQALIATLAVLAAARLAFAFVPGTWGWSLAVARDLDPVTAWLPWLVAGLALLPPVNGRLAPAVEALDRFAVAPRRAMAIAAVLAAALVLALPDRVRFVGDAILRLRTLQVQGLIPTGWYPQALPLDLAIHHGFASALMRTLEVPADWPGRLFGAVDCALMALCAWGLPRALRLRGPAALAAGATLFWTGALTLFTGYNKAFAEMAVLTAATGVLALRAASTGRGLMALGGVLALALLTHRSALALIPVAALAWSLARRTPAPPDRGPLAIAALVPLAVLAAMAPRIVHIVTKIDPMHFTPETWAGHGAAGAFFGGERPIDLANLLLFLVPIAPVVPVLALTVGRAPFARREAAVLLVLAVPFLAVMPFIHPGQGLFRDWDDFAAAGVALALVAAWLVGETVRSAPRAAAMAAVVTLAVAAPTLQWLGHHAETDRGLVRVRRFVTEPPERIAFERAVTWQFLGQAEGDLGHADVSADAYAAASRLLPSPNMIRQWGASELRAGRFEAARGVFRELIARDSSSAFGWVGLELAAGRLGDEAESRRAAERAAELDPQGSVRSAVMWTLGGESPAEARP